MLLLVQDFTKKERVEKIFKLDANNNSKEYKVEKTWDSVVYGNKIKGHL